MSGSVSFWAGGLPRFRSPPNLGASKNCSLRAKEARRGNRAATEFGVDRGKNIRSETGVARLAMAIKPADRTSKKAGGQQHELRRFWQTVCWVGTSENDA
jgi:hypothetical protein